MNKSNYNCEIIQDLLPLYKDNACSSTSREIVDEHLLECEKCKNMLNNLQNTSVDDFIISSKNSILENYAKKERKRTTIIGIFTASILMIPVIVCLICNIAIGHGLDWFFIVLTSLLIVASITLVPLFVRKNSILWTMGSFTVSLLLLLMTCCIYTNGNWFFVAATPVVFGLSIVFMPYIIRHIQLPKSLQNKKALLTMLWDSLWLYILIMECGIYTGYEPYWRNALLITTFSITLPWLMFIIIRYLKLHPLTKAGICTIIIGTFTTFANDVINLIIYGNIPNKITNANLLNWHINVLTTDANIRLSTLLVSIIIGISLIICGLGASNNKKES